MKSMRVNRYAVLLLVLTVFAVLLASGCRSAPVYNVHDANMVTGSDSPALDEVDQAIKKAGIKLGWDMKTVDPGHIVGTLRIRAHMAVVDIRFNKETFSITYKDSNNLEYNGREIHSNYNGWVQNLEQAIRNELLSV